MEAQRHMMGEEDDDDVLATASSTSVTVELTDYGSVTKPVSLTIATATLKAVVTTARQKFRNKTFSCSLLFINSKNCLEQQHTTGTQTLYNVESDEDLQFVLRFVKRPCLLFTNKVPAHAGSLTKYKEAKGIINDAGKTAVCFIIGNESATEQSAVEQLRQVSGMPDVLCCIGMPDLHAGKGIPIGAVVVTAQHTAYPQLIDSDIGCGMSFVETSLQTGKLTTNKLRKIKDGLESIDCAYKNVEEMKERCAQALQWASKHVEALPELPSDEHYMRLGTIGGGNHFAELQEFKSITDAAALVRHGIDATKVHCWCTVAVGVWVPTLSKTFANRRLPTIR